MVKVESSDKERLLIWRTCPFYTENPLIKADSCGFNQGDTLDNFLLNDNKFITKCAS